MRKVGFGGGVTIHKIMFQYIHMCAQYIYIYLFFYVIHIFFSVYIYIYNVVKQNDTVKVYHI
jgi:hypothetical protein